MKGKIFTTSLLAVVSVALLGSLFFFVRVGATADAVAVLKTAGMTCGSCASTITKELQKQAGVVSIEVDLNGGWVIVGYDSKKIDPRALVAMVRSSGFASNVQTVLTPMQFKELTGREIDGKAAGGCGGCGTKGCGNNKNS